ERILALLDLDSSRGRIVSPGLSIPYQARLRGIRPPRLAVEDAHVEVDPRPGSTALRLLHFGNLCAEKGSIDIVETMAMLPEGFATLTLAGRALTPGFESRVERARGTAQVRILGPYDVRALERAAAEADLAVFPTRLEESYGLVLDEAHALGLPAWTSDRGALAERLLAGERSLPAENPAAWARALQDHASEVPALADSVARVGPSSVPSLIDSVLAHEKLYQLALGERSA
ncbi:MAG TPA: glycosyltransferase, partial [Planctomycetota bacterium]|nr:glycosyltransferase [Planctomycetota bacterium]